MRDTSPACLADALQWLRDHTDELQPVPVRLHDSVVGDHDLSGAPRFSPAFWAVLTGSPFATRDGTTEVMCAMPHPHDAVCVRCDNRLSYRIVREVYAYPLAAALERLRKAPATSHDWPTPYQMVVTLMRCNYDLDIAARIIDHPILGADHRHTVETAFLLSIRKLVARWQSGPIPNARRSDAQANAEAAA